MTNIGSSTSINDFFELMTSHILKYICTDVIVVHKNITTNKISKIC